MTRFKLHNAQLSVGLVPFLWLTMLCAPVLGYSAVETTADKALIQTTTQCTDHEALQHTAYLTSGRVSIDDASTRADHAQHLINHLQTLTPDDTPFCDPSNYHYILCIDTAAQTQQSLVDLFSLPLQTLQSITIQEDKPSTHKIPQFNIPAATCSHDYDQCQGLPPGPDTLRLSSVTHSILHPPVYTLRMDSTPLHPPTRIAAWSRLRKGPSTEYALPPDKPPMAFFDA